MAPFSWLSASTMEESLTFVPDPLKDLDNTAGLLKALRCSSDTLATLMRAPSGLQSHSDQPASCDLFELILLLACRFREPGFVRSSFRDFLEAAVCANFEILQFVKLFIAANCSLRHLLMQSFSEGWVEGIYLEKFLVSCCLGAGNVMLASGGSLLGTLEETTEEGLFTVLFIVLDVICSPLATLLLERHDSFRNLLETRLLRLMESRGIEAPHILLEILTRMGISLKGQRENSPPHQVQKVDSIGYFMTRLLSSLLAETIDECVGSMSLAILNISFVPASLDQSSFVRAVGIHSPGSICAIQRHEWRNLATFAITGCDQLGSDTLREISAAYMMFLGPEKGFYDVSVKSKLCYAVGLFAFASSSAKADRFVKLVDSKNEDHRQIRWVDCAAESLLYFIEVFADITVFDAGIAFFDQLRTLWHTLHPTPLSQLLLENLSGALFFITSASFVGDRRCQSFWSALELREVFILMELLGDLLPQTTEEIFTVLRSKNITFADWEALRDLAKSRPSWDRAIQEIPIAPTIFSEERVREQTMAMRATITTKPGNQFTDFLSLLPSDVLSTEFPGIKEALSVLILYYCRHCLLAFNTDFEGIIGYNFVAQECTEALGLRQALNHQDGGLALFEGSWASDLWGRLDASSREFVSPFLRSRYVSPAITEAGRASLPFYSSQCLDTFPVNFRPFLMAADLLHKLYESLDSIEAMFTGSLDEETLSFCVVLLFELSKMQIGSIKLSLSEIFSKASYNCVERMATGLLRQGLYPYVLLLLDIACRNSEYQDEYFESMQRVFNDMGQRDSAQGYMCRNKAAIINDLLLSAADGGTNEGHDSFFEALQLWGLDCDNYDKVRPSLSTGTVLLNFLSDLLLEEPKAMDFFRIRKDTAQLSLDTIKESIEVCNQLGRVVPRDLTKVLNYLLILREGREGNHQAALRSLLSQGNNDSLYFYCMARTLELSNRPNDITEYFYSSALTLASPEHRPKVSRSLVKFLVSSRTYPDGRIQEAFKKCFEINDSDPKCLLLFADYMSDCSLETKDSGRHYAALKSYAKTFLTCDRFDHVSCSRFLSIWSLMTDVMPHPDSSNDFVRKAFVLASKVARRTPIFKFLPSISQLSSRMCQSDAQSLQILQLYLVRLVQEYPHTTIWKIINFPLSINHTRKARYNGLVSSIKASPGLGTLWDDYLQLAQALITICEVSRGREAVLQLSRVTPKIHSLNLASVAAPISKVIYQTNSKSSTPIMMDRFEDRVEVLSSLQKPKKLLVHCTDGKIRSFLCKPKDDMRKDMRFLELATLINMLFLKKLRRSTTQIQTYSALPINEEAGIIEWVERTSSLRLILSKLYTAAGIQINYSEIKELQKLPGFSETFATAILPRFPPQLYKWFYTQFPSPQVWLDSRFMFTRTAAAMSMFGHVMGLGDRHCENILLSEASGAVIHVDFSCMFEKGKTLEIPERVPFRLTQNLSNAMGLCEWRGEFQHHCASTLKIFKVSRRVLNALLEPVVYDPITEFQNCQTAHKEAMETINNKLLGIENGSVFDTISGHVSYLIGRAACPENLSKIAMLIKIAEAVGIPLLSGSFFCKYTVSVGGRTICKGKTCSATLSNYRAAWNEVFDCSGVGASNDIVLALKVFQESESNVCFGWANLTIPAQNALDGYSVLLNDTRTNSSVTIKFIPDIHDGDDQKQAGQGGQLSSALEPYDHSCSSTEADEEICLVDNILNV